MAAPQRISPPPLYKDSLTTSLHRRFTKAASVALLACYVDSVVIGDKSSFLWSWFPLGLAGVRTLFLFISALAIFVLRVAQLRISARTTLSPLDTASRGIFQFHSLQTLAWYIFSAWWFSEVYVWSVPREANLAWIAQTKPYERPQLNERPIYLRTIFFILAWMQACIHLFYDYDRVSLPATATHAGLLAKGASIAPPAPHEQLMTELPSRVQAAFFRSLSMAVVGPLVYSFFLRRITWRWTMVFAERVWTLPRASSVPPSTPPYQFSLLARSVLAGFLLVLLWEISAISLGVYVAQEPLKRGRPLTDYSKDPNGTLITGLRSKREIPRSFAYWELFLIAERFPARRKTFFEEIDRRGGATWSQLMNACSGVIQSLNSRMVEAMMPPAPSAQQPPPQQGIVQALPRISPPLNEDPIFQGPPPPVTRRDHVQSRMGAFARSHGQYPITAQQGWTPIDLLQWLFHQAVDRLITPEQKQALSQSQLSARVNEYALAFLRSPLGAPFQQTLSRRSAAVVLGSPRGDLGVLLDAIDALSLLATDSMAEDPYGKVQADIAALVNMYTVTIQNLTVFQTQFPPHWTDVEADQRRQRRERRRLRQPLPLPHAPVPDPDSDFAEVDVLLRALKGGLARMLDAFGAYAGSLGLSGNEMRLAREMAGVAITGKDGDGKGGEGGPGGRPTGRIGLT